MNRTLSILPWLAGVVLVGGSLLGATRLLPAAGEQPEVPPAAKTNTGAVTALGTVASDPGASPVGPPAVAAMVSVAQVFVQDGQAVEVGDKLVQFDDSLATPKVPQAQAELDIARELVGQAEAQMAIHKKKIEGQQVAIQTAETEIARAESSLEIGRRNALALLVTNPYSGQRYTEAEQQAKLRDNLDLRKGESDVNVARSKLLGEKITLEALSLAPVEADLRAAKFKVARLEATVSEARAAVAAHTVTARLKGVVEQVFAAPGMSYGPATRVPLLYLVPAGRRVVRAEVEAEFVARVSEKAGGAVTVVDANNFALAYPGTVRRVGGAFFPKRSQADGLALTVVKVIEVIIDLGETPKGTPPLLVGQPVRVTFH